MGNPAVIGKHLGQGAKHSARLVLGDKATAKPLLQEVIRRGNHDWAEICRKVDEHHCQIWLAVTDKPIAALVTQMTTDDVLECLIAGGTDAKQWARVAEGHLARFAAENGSQRLRIWGRRGWLRVFPHWTHMRDEDELVVMETRI